MPQSYSPPKTQKPVYNKPRPTRPAYKPQEPPKQTYQRPASPPQQHYAPSQPDPVYIPAPSQYNKPPIIIYQGVRPPVHVYEKPNQKPAKTHYQARAQAKVSAPVAPVASVAPVSRAQVAPVARAPVATKVAPTLKQTSKANSRSDFTIVGKQKLGSSIRGPTKLVDIKAPDLSLSRDKPLTRSITLSASQGVASARVDPGPNNNDRSAVVRAVVSVSDSDGNLVRRGTVTDITN